MKKFLILIMLIFITGCEVKEIDNYDFIDEIVLKDSSNINQYYINGYLDSVDNKLIVKQKIIYNTEYNLDELYLNVYANANSTSKSDVYISNIKLNDDEVDWNWSDNFSNININLDEDINKGEDISIDLTYELPFWDKGRFSSIMTDSGDMDYIAMFFYPVVAMYDESGWHTDPHSFQGEVYYNSISDYFVNLELPKELKLASSGNILSQEELDNTTKYEIELLNGRDYSFSASSSYHEYNKTINNIDVKIIGLNELSSSAVDDLFDLIEKTFTFTEDTVGPYIYDTFTLELGHIYGMESSSIVYCSEVVNSGTVVHEIYHQWFYSMIGNNQADESWLDEGLTSFMTGEFFKEYPELITNGYYQVRDTNQEKFTWAHETFSGSPVLKNVHDFDTHDYEYAILVYYYGSTLLNFYLQNYLDENNGLMYQAFQRYYDEYNNKTATVDDFLTILEEVSGVENTKEWFIDHLNGFQIIE